MGVSDLFYSILYGREAWGQAGSDILLDLLTLADFARMHLGRRS